VREVVIRARKRIIIPRGRGDEGKSMDRAVLIIRDRRYIIFNRGEERVNRAYWLLADVSK
jgi:hypothetical protein